MLIEETGVEEEAEAETEGEIEETEEAEEVEETGQAEEAEVAEVEKEETEAEEIGEEGEIGQARATEEAGVKPMITTRRTGTMTNPIHTR